MTRRLQIISRILEAVSQSRSICIVGHGRPDGDCIGSQIALTLALRGQGRRVQCWNQDPVPGKLKFLDPDGVVTMPVASVRLDCVIAVDCASYERLGDLCARLERRRLLINIDHHASNHRFGDLNWVVPRSPSTGELIHRLLRQAQWPITPDIANALLTAISTDTGSFQYPSTRPSTHRTAAELLTRGADSARICQEVYQSYPLGRVRLLRHLYNRFKLRHHNQIGSFWLRRRDYTLTGAKPDDAEGLIEQIRDIGSVRVACLFEELEPGLTRLSLRSKTPAVNVADVAAQFGGGGHGAAAGARIPGDARKVERLVLDALKAALNGHQH